VKSIFFTDDYVCSGNRVMLADPAPRVVVHEID